jgi:LuxR family maltose regulon positive regulatory protein
MLRRLEAENLFVVPLDNERLWFAYHALMASFLRAVHRQREPNGAAAVHLRAAEWFEARGDILDAIQHSLRAGDYKTVGRLIRSNGLALVFQGELATVLAWLHDSRASWPKTGPWLRIAQLWAHSFSGDETTISDELAETRALVGEGLHGLEEHPDSTAVTELRQALAHLTAIEAQLAFMDGRHEDASRLARQAVYDLPLADSTTRRYSYVILGMALRQLGELSAAVDALLQADAPIGEGERVPAPARGLATLAAIQIWMGRLDEAEVTCRRLIALHDDHLRRCGRRLPIAAFGYARLSEVCRQKNQVDEAIRLAQESRALADPWHQMDALYESYTHLARALQTSGDSEAALALLHRLEQLVRGRFPWLHGMTLLEEARCASPTRTTRLASIGLAPGPRPIRSPSMRSWSSATTPST